MNSTDMSLDATVRAEAGAHTPRKSGPAAFIALALLALAICAVALYAGRAPLLSPYPEDWIGWARTTLTWSGVFAVGVVLLVIGVIGTARTLLPVRQPRRHTMPSSAFTSETAAPAAFAEDAVSAAPAAQSEPRPPRGNLKFDASRIVSPPSEPLESAPVESALTEPAPPESTGPAMTAPARMTPALGVDSLEPAIFHDPIFHDNASDSFMSQVPLVETATFDATAALNTTHGLHVHSPSAQIIPIRPDGPHPDLAAAEMTPPEVAPDSAHDPLAAALLAEAPDPVVHAPAGDMNAVINSTLRFAPQTPEDSAPAFVTMPVETPEEVAQDMIPKAGLTETAHDAAPEATSAETSEAAPLAEPATVGPAAVDDEAEIRQAVQTALSVWPDATRAIAADELSVRIAHLYYDPSPQSTQAFQAIAGGDLSGASSSLQSHAASLAAAGLTAQAAELWRIVGALHMGRDDARAMNAYEHVSALDPSDANIHLYLARRYQMAGDTAKQPVAIARALGVISDPVTRAELLAPYADLMLKSGDVKAGGDALEELSRLHETTAYLRPDDVAARSAHAITVARLAQTREMQGDYDQAGPLYKKAHQVFADLSAMKPEHPGLRAMAENALRDAQRFQTAS
ncbi:hypothetical protein [Asticcacaulis sp. EMRT-3]|uniref:tetratricopeptide repeat protein n=1 Tax=Asticcacaulis sp. EMRT-3 TaxID=3040349 RepID=UPI0024AF8252|nr:hypothetical protein [Asticcacaulis sp. EMRT-3]MDI7776320.1 hypothetical protein [Asticcacaulis sp. EMRT-3]